LKKLESNIAAQDGQEPGKHSAGSAGQGPNEDGEWVGRGGIIYHKRPALPNDAMWFPFNIVIFFCLSVFRLSDVLQ